jgi:hypothetical protein
MILIGNVLNCLLVMGNHAGAHEEAIWAAIGAGMVALVLPLPRRWP